MTATLEGLESGPHILRSGAFHGLLSHFRLAGLEGQGPAVVPGDSDITRLLDGVISPQGPARAECAVLLGLLLDREDSERVGAVDSLIRRHAAARLPELLECAEAVSDASDASQTRSALLFLFGHLVQDHPEIVDSASSAFGAESGAAHALARIRDDAVERPQRAAQVRAYLGAEAFSPLAADRLELARRTLACPGCHDALDFGPEEIRCVSCGEAFSWVDGHPNLPPRGVEQRDEFPEDVAEVYETALRPRFVKVMGRAFGAGDAEESELRYLSDRLRVGEGTVLDLGCGAGTWTARVAALVGSDRVVAIDWSAAMLRRCARRVPGAIIVRGSAQAIPVATGSMAAAVCWDALQAFPQPGGAVAEVARCLAPGGLFVGFTFRSSPGPYAYFQERITANPRHLLDLDRFRAWCADAGLDIEDLTVANDAVLFSARRSA